MSAFPLFINTLGHCAGVTTFAILFYVFLADWKRSERPLSGLSAIAAGLGLIWNFGDLLALDSTLSQHPAFHVLHALALSALSFLPAVLLHIWLERRAKYLWISGYFLSFGAVILQIRAELTETLPASEAATLLVATGFGGLTIICLLQALRHTRLRWAEARLAAAMLLLLPAIFLVSGDASQVVHFPHAGIPLSVFVVLFDFRFLILDELSRFFMRTILAAGGTAVSFAAALQFHFDSSDPFRIALALAAVLGGSLATITLSPLVDRMTLWLLRRESRLDPILGMLRDYPAAEHSDDEYLDHARSTIETFFECAVSEFRDLLQSPELEACLGPVALPDRSRWPLLNSVSWAEAALPLRLARGEGRLLLLGPRRGRRPYRDADLLALSRFGRTVEEHVERGRQLRAQAFVSQAELRALQAQINPHFFFNSLNTLYAVISRDNAEARHLVLNLAEVFHYLLRSDRTFISLKKELAIVNAYLEIEKLRLGPRLTTSIQIDEHLLETEIPVLSIQPLVENAVKHGVASRSNNGSVSLTIRSEGAHLKIEVTNTGEFSSNRSLNGTGVGLENVQRRLMLCYGFAAELHIYSRENLTLVCCSMPLSIQMPQDRANSTLKNTLPGRFLGKTA